MGGDLLGDLLRQVSRSFYLSLAVLPGPLREPIGLAYLLARAADTVADTRLIKCEGRLGHLHARRADPLHVSGGGLRRAVLAAAARGAPAAAQRLGAARDERAGRELRQGATAHQRPARRTRRSCPRPMLPAGARTGG